MRASDYPVPDYAAYIWHRGDALAVGLPDGRTLFVPIGKMGNAPGVQFLLDLLRARKENDDNRRASQLATPAAPTQLQLEEALKAHNVKRAASRTLDADIFDFDVELEQREQSDER